MDDRDWERKAGRVMGILTTVAALIFTVVWCGLAAGMGAWPMLLAGLPLVGLTIYRLIVTIRLTRENGRESGSGNPRHREEPWENPPASSVRDMGYCPYCGTPISREFDYCPKCGRRLQ